MSKFAFGTLWALLTLCGAGIVSADDTSAHIQLQAQIWSRPLGIDNRLKFKTLGTGGKIDTTLSPQSRITTSSTDILTPEITATATFLMVPATAKVAAYLVTQVSVYNGKTHGLIAECANYDTLIAERALGVGVCSGVIGDNQYGLTLSKSP